jgi:hypothetical protein
MDDCGILQVPKFETSRSIARAIYGECLFPDERLRRRVITIASRLSRFPGKPLMQVFGDWGQSKGLYRFIENRRVGIEMIGHPLFENGSKNCRGHHEIIVVGDTTTLSFPRTEIRKEFGPTNDNPHTKGMFLHTALALSGSGVPLGILDQKAWMRKVEVRDEKEDLKKVPIGEKESFKWIEVARNSHNRLKKAGYQGDITYVGDRENDIHEFFEEMEDIKTYAVVRSSWNRRVSEETKHLWNHLASQPIMHWMTIEVPKKSGYAKRRAHVCVRFVEEATLSPRKDKHPNRRKVKLAAVWVYEEKLPEDVPEEQRIDWKLITNKAVKTIEEAEIYKMRWRIEELHFIMKSGCNIEHYQFENFERYAKFILIILHVAFELYLSRIHPDIPAKDVLSEIQYDVLLRATKIRDGPEKTMTLSEAVKLIGKLGGHLGRRRDGSPGSKMLWRGWRDLQLLVDYEMMKTGSVE